MLREVTWLAKAPYKIFDPAWLLFFLFVLSIILVVVLKDKSKPVHEKPEHKNGNKNHKAYNPD